jgi:hypothetical protein
MAFVLASLSIGVVLGQRFKVPVLVPGSGLALMITILAGIERGDAVWPIVLTSLAVVSGLQIGYLIGTAISHLIKAARTARLRGGVLGAAMPIRHPAH